MAPSNRPVGINLSAAPAGGVGGLGFVALAVLISIVDPDLWWVITIAAIGGVVLGAILIVDSRHTILSGRPPDITTLRPGPGTGRIRR